MWEHIINYKNNLCKIRAEEFPNFTIFELKEPLGNIPIGVYRSKVGTIKVSKVKNNRIYLTFSVDMRHEYTNETITINGEVDGVSYVTIP